MTTPDERTLPLPAEPAAFWSAPDDPAADEMPTDDGAAPTALAKRLGPFPGWRGAEDLLFVLEDIYEKAAETARARLRGEID